MSEQFDLFADPPPEPEKEEAQVENEGPRVAYFDLETQKGADEVGGWNNSHLMKLAVGVVWDSVDEQYHSYLEKDAAQLVEKLRLADLVVGFNVIGFDYAVLQPYASIDLMEINTFDMLVHVHKKLGFRLGLNHLAQHTLGAEKNADGLISLQWYKEGKMDKIIEYCIQDVKITRDLYLFGEKHQYINYQGKDRAKTIHKLEVDWNTQNLLK